MNAQDANTMLLTLSKTTKKMIGEEVLSSPVPKPNEIWATVVALNSKLNTLRNSLDTLESKLDRPTASHNP